jgi:hypothetical protein
VRVSAGARMIASTNAKNAPSETDSPRNGASLVRTGDRSPLQQLLHALNQPLTGLQCLMEVALATPRPVEYHVRQLREGLDLTERMRTLVGAIQEVEDVAEEKNGEPETIELKILLREVVDDLRIVAEVRSVGFAVEDTAASLFVRAGRRGLSTLLFQLLEAALSLAEPGTALQIQIGEITDYVWIRVRWIVGPRPAELSPPELGLLVGQAGWERVGAKWERERTKNLETVTVRLASVSARSDNS